MSNLGVEVLKRYARGGGLRDDLRPPARPPGNCLRLGQNSSDWISTISNAEITCYRRHQHHPASRTGIATSGGVRDSRNDK